MSQNFDCYEDGQAVNGTTAANGTTTPLTGDPTRIRTARDIMFDNPGPYDVHVKVGDSSVTASTVNKRVPAGAIWTYAKGPGTHVAVLSIGGPQQIRVHLGEGS